ncbi:hypothetical protein BYZ73_13965 [Rhodovulum viride]|uniref:HTH tetR-type domain-containing protein n=1 Tax=Rhodovulum viride TaxID=1231134 RepID=A0ABX9DGI7_9RHOB|nr:CerR family C-terminal domain-containing protein [Rhodovulum viride]RAP40685.1 hypothetical protein BYZ73_13965 [Rhodovulum viride]
MSDDPAPRSTPETLIEAALHLFGHRGFAPTSTREIAARAGTNVASIAYHFGGKAGLRRACAEAVAERIGSAIGPLDGAGALPETPEGAQALLDAALRRFVRFIVADPAAADAVAFMLRELTDPGEAADVIYASVLEPRHRALCALWGRATGQPAESDAVKLAVFAAIGQAVYFRIAQPVIARRLDWTAVGPDEAEAIAGLLAANLSAMIESQRR